MSNKSKIASIIILSLSISKPILADGLKSAGWFVQKNEHTLRNGNKKDSVNVSDKNIPSESIGALIRQSVASMQIRIDNIKAKLKNGNVLDKSDKEFLKDVSRHQSLSKYIDNEFWALIAKRSEIGERWADEIITLSGRRSNSFSSDNGSDVTAQKSGAAYSESGVDVVEENGERRIIPKYNGITQSVLSGFKGPDYSSTPSDVVYFSTDGFNFVQSRSRRENIHAEQKRDYEKKIFERKYVEDRAGYSSQDVSYQDDLKGVLNSSPAPSKSGDHQIAAFDSNTYVTKILDEVTAGLSRRERNDIESSVATILESTGSASGTRLPASNDSDEEARNREGKGNHAEVTSSNGSASAHR